MNAARDPRWWLGLTSLGLVLWVVWIDLDAAGSPGPLTSTHAQVESLRGVDGCRVCHVEAGAALDPGCLECHAAVAQQLEAGTGFHGTLDAGPDARCVRCHTEHHGDSLDLVGERAFELSGYDSRADFLHSGLAYDLAGRHDELECEACHANADAALLAEGEVRFLGLDDTCTACHEDPHEGSMHAVCADCHGQDRPFPEAALFEHTEVFDLVGAHAERACVDCHEVGSFHSIEALSGDRGREARSCDACHDSPHDARLLTAAGGSCAVCHDGVHEGFGSVLSRMSPEHHALTGFALARPHDAVECADCHAGNPGATFAERFPGRAPSGCSECHADPHGGQFERGRFADSECTACHAATHFSPVTFGVEQHTTFPLVGSHGGVGCQLCHRLPGAGQPRTFNGLPQDCGSCHADAHAAAFGATGCEVCHTEESFRDAQPAFDHGRWTEWPLTGAHLRADCEACHRRADAPDEVHRTFGRVAALFEGDLDACETCHADVHEGAFDAGWAVDSTSRNARGCDRCHDTESFANVDLDAFDHGRWTGYALRGAHAAVACRGCHAPASHGGSTGAGTRIGTVTGKTCASCHEDVHVGQFARGGQTDCSRCHVDQSSFSRTAFDHARDSRFPLDATHEKLSCSACHQQWPLPTGGTAVRYKPLGTLCGDCHLPGGGE